MIVALTVVAILSTGMAVFLRAPLQAYFDVTGRALIGDAADLTLKRLSEDVATALPNSVRIRQVGASYFLEFLQVRTSGRYRNGTPYPAGCPGNASLDFGVVDNCFVTVGPVAGAVAPVAGDFIVVDNGGAGCPVNAYTSGAATGGNKSQVTGYTQFGGAAPYDRIRMQNVTLPATCQSPNFLFYVVSQAVSYECDPSPGNPSAGVLLRHSGYPIAALQPVAFGGGTTAQLATGVAGCAFSYLSNPNASTASGTVGVSLVLSRTDAAAATGTESVTLFTQIHVNEAL